MYWFKRHKLKKGVALITAMMVMSLATITAVQMTSEQQIYFRRTENILLHQQAYLYLLSAEDYAKTRLAEDFNKNNIDAYNTDEAWYSPEPVVFPVEGGVLTGSVSDLQGKININNLYIAPRKKWDEDRLREALAINNISIDIANVIIDWIDLDTTALPGGAEDVDYLAGDRPYRTGNNMMGSISELKLLKGVDEEIYEKLEKILIALPATSLAINVNTAPPEVLRIIVPGLSEEDAKTLAEELNDEPLDDPQDLLNHSLVRGNNSVDLNGLGVESNYFLLDAMAGVGRAKSRIHTILYRQDANNIHVVTRSQGGL